MKGTTWTVTDKTNDKTFHYKRYAPSGAYYMKREGDTRFNRVTRDELFKSLTKASVQNRG